MLFELITSPYVLSILMAWFTAHLIKYSISLLRRERQKLRTYLFISGGMPSAHSAAVTAMSTVIGFRDGVGSSIFGLALLFSCITVYDAMKVRRSSGEQGLAIRQLIIDTKSKIKLPRVAMGHTPFEVGVGILLGLAVGGIVFLSTK